MNSILYSQLVKCADASKLLVQLVDVHVGAVDPQVAFLRLSNVVASASWCIAIFL